MKITVTKRVEIGGKVFEHSASSELPDRVISVSEMMRGHSRAIIDGINTDLSEERARALFNALPAGAATR